MVDRYSEGSLRFRERDRRDQGHSAYFLACQEQFWSRFSMDISSLKSSMIHSKAELRF
jgi:hypothetical protein